MKYIFEVIILTWWKMVIDRRNHCCFFPVDIAEYEKWHLVVAIFCSQMNKPQLFCIECSASFVWVFLWVMYVVVKRLEIYVLLSKEKRIYGVLPQKNILKWAQTILNVLDR